MGAEEMAKYVNDLHVEVKINIKKSWNTMQKMPIKPEKYGL